MRMMMILLTLSFLVHVPFVKAASLPERLVFGDEALRELHFSEDIRYAYASGALVRQLNAATLDGMTAEEVISKLAPVHKIVGGVHVLEASVQKDRLAELIKAAKSGNADKRRVAAYKLGSLRSSEGLSTLCELLDDPDDSVRHHALHSLLRIEDGYKAADPGRVSLLSLVELPAETQLHLLNLLRNAPSPETHEWLWAAQLCSRAGLDEALPLIAAEAEHDLVTVRRTVEEAMRGMGKSAELPSRPSREYTAALLKKLDDVDEPSKRGSLLLKLGDSGGAEVWPILIAELDNPNDIVRRSAIRALRRCPTVAAVPPLMERFASKGSPSDDRYVAAITLGLIGSPEVVDALIDHIENPGPLEIKEAPMALGYAGDTRAVPAIIRYLKKGGDHKSHAATALARLATPEGMDALAKAGGDPSNVPRYQAVAATRLACRWHQSAVDHFIKVLKTGSKAAAHALESSSDPRAVDALIGELSKSHDRRLQSLIDSLGMIGDPKAVPALIDLMKSHEKESVRYMAMRALRWRWYIHRPEVRKAFKADPVFRAFVEPQPAYEDQPENTWVPRRWAADLQDTRTGRNTYETGMVYDPHTDRIMKWGSHGDRTDTPQNHYTWRYDPESRKWRESRAPVHPFGMCGTWGMTYDPVSRRVYSVQASGGNHGWQWSRARAMRPASPWAYDVAADRWTPMIRCEHAYGPGQRGFMPLAYHDKAQVVFLYGGQSGFNRRGKKADRGWIYDPYINTWDLLPAKGMLPGSRAHHGMCYMPGIDRILMTGGSYQKSDDNTYLFDLEKNSWTNLTRETENPRFRLPVLHDPVTETALKFSGRHKGALVWQFDMENAKWKKLPVPDGPRPFHSSIDVVYDSRRNLYVMDCGHVGWATDRLAVRELWTYRFKRRDAGDADKRLPAPGNLSLTCGGRGKQPAVRVEWDAVRGADGYSVQICRADRPWHTKWDAGRKLETKKTHALVPVDNADGSNYVRVIAHKGESRGVPSHMLRTRPPLAENIVAGVEKDGGVSIRWDASGSDSVKGYHVYAADVKLGRMNPFTFYRDIRPYKRLTKEPIKKPHLRDKRPLGSIDHEITDREVRAYVVRAVNGWGVESGPSAAALTLPSPVPSVKAVPLADGRVRVSWQESPEKNLAGYRVYRMDSYRRTICILLNPEPVKGTEFIDRPDAPRAERRKYYVVAVDALGQEGIPSSGVYSYGRP